MPVQFPILSRRDFYDVPRLMLTRWENIAVVLDCEFDAAIDDYPDDYEVSWVSNDVDWNQVSPDSLPNRNKLGTVAVADVEFDATRRSWFASSSLEALLKTLQTHG